MSDATDLVAAVEQDATLTTLVEGRIYPFVLPPDPTLPALTYQLVSQPTLRTQEGHGYRWPRWRIRIISDRYADLEPIALALARVFEDQGRTPFSRSWVEASTESRESDTGRFWRLVDILAFQPGGVTAQ